MSRERLVFTEFVDFYPQHAQELYDKLATKVWFLDKHFEEGEVNFENTNGVIRIIDVRISEEKSLGKEKELELLNKYFEKNFGTLTPVKFRTPSIFVGLTKIYSSENDCKSEWEIKNVIGKGVQGLTYAACCKTDCSHVLKIEELSSMENDFKQEAELSIEFGDKGIGPKVIAEYIGKDIGMIIMERFTMTLYDLLKIWKAKGQNYFGVETLHILRDKYFEVVKKLHNLGYFHGDLHLNNIMIKIHKDNLKVELETGQYKLRLIDFGRIGSVDTDFADVAKEEEDFDHIFTRHLPPHSV